MYLLLCIVLVSECPPWMRLNQRSRQRCWQGWQGAQTLLREVSLDSDTGALLMNPLPELADLRSAVLFDGSVSDLQPAADVKHNVGADTLHCTASMPYLVAVARVLPCMASASAEPRQLTMSC